MLAVGVGIEQAGGQWARGRRRNRGLADAPGEGATLLGRSDGLDPEELDLLAENLGGGAGVTFRLPLRDSGAGRRREANEGGWPVRC